MKINIDVNYDFPITFQTNLVCIVNKFIDVAVSKTVNLTFQLYLLYIYGIVCVCVFVYKIVFQPNMLTGMDMHAYIVSCSWWCCRCCCCTMLWYHAQFMLLYVFNQQSSICWIYCWMVVSTFSRRFCW